MNDNKSRQFQLNAGSGMALGAIGGALVALLVSTITGDSAVWSWAIPVGLAVGLALGAGATAEKDDNRNG